MIFFSGFALKGEKELFTPWLIESDYSVAGFSYGAIKALEYASASKERIDHLLLLSPAFFQTRSKRYISLQLEAFSRDSKLYIKRFLERAAMPYQFDLHPYLGEASIDQLEELLRYRWDELKLRNIIEHGTTVEVVIADDDSIIDAKGALEFFTPLATATYHLRRGGHLLLLEDNLRAGAQSKVNL